MNNTYTLDESFYIVELLKAVSNQVVRILNQSTVLTHFLLK
ncbi:hypothetical protein [Subsaximicrobium wynnwilliamsii]|nr:hypothetical protein [Subsaximicrobium wynnwilliamsii]